MHQTKNLFFLLLCYCIVNSCSTNKPLAKRNLPNIVYILADDLGYGDISVLNKASKITTPHIDKLANNGIYFTDAHSGSAVCTPTRYGILTGRYAWRSSLQKGVTWSWDTPLIQETQPTVAKLLQKENYHTACIGKWHLGLGWQKGPNDEVDVRKPLTSGPNDLGFDYFFGITASLDIPPYVYIENNQSTSTDIDTIAANDVQGMAFWRKGPIGHDFKMEEVLPYLTHKSVTYIQEQAKTPNPFFLYFPLPAPHTPILPTAQFLGKTNTNPYGDFVLMVDDVVGQVVQALRESGVEDNTIIIFTSDNGCSPRANFEELTTLGHQPSHTYRGHKADIFEGGHRIPFIAQWKAGLSPQIVSDQTICLTDLYATCAALVDHSLLADEGVDSYNMLPMLKGEKSTKNTRPATVHHSINGSFALRKDQWKLILCPGSGGWSEPVPKKAKELNLLPIQLFDLSTDIAEQMNVATQQPHVVKELTSLLKSYIDRGRSTSGDDQINDVVVEMIKE